MPSSDTKQYVWFLPQVLAGAVPRPALQLVCREIQVVICRQRERVRPEDTRIMRQSVDTAVRQPALNRIVFIVAEVNASFPIGL